MDARETIAIPEGLSWDEAAAVPLKRGPNPEDIAAAVLYLVSAFPFVCGGLVATLVTGRVLQGQAPGENSADANES